MACKTGFQYVKGKKGFHGRIVANILTISLKKGGNRVRWKSLNFVVTIRL
jgi:hypothetical protein